MLKMCPYCNFTSTNERFSYINCKSGNSGRANRFKTLEKMEKHYSKYCCSNYKWCVNYKILKAAEVVWDEKEEKEFNQRVKLDLIAKQQCNKVGKVNE